MTSRILAAALYMICCALFIRHFWLQWAPQCNEACPKGIVVSIYVTLTVIFATTLAVAIATLLGQIGRRASLLGFLCLCVIALSASYGISHSLGS